MVKEGGVISEQTFLISIQVTDSAPSGTNIQTATLLQDYEFGDGIRTSVTEFFFPFQQRIPFRFSLFADELPEGTEAFQLSASPKDSRPRGPGQPDERFPASLTPEVLVTEVFVTILDDDRKIQSIMAGHCTFLANFILFLVIIIGFTNTSYTVSESDGVAYIQIRVIEGSLGRRQMTVEFSTGAASAASK